MSYIKKIIDECENNTKSWLTLEKVNEIFFIVCGLFIASAIIHYAIN